ncbi:50S ribosomal protein L22 [Candidatus Peregrinibacteria bacterium CG10_big_fil_rev_8_21_14_0_10_54_7]|nr:MAG: 50S ribosomal protein L22 [Candidatus Peregrinibacteria bacterium CG10_big_fil_rev_8_21_14_0_10_54_7]
MKASLRSVRIAPQKVNLIAKMVRGKPVPEAIAALERTNKKAARLLEGLVRSAMANAGHNDKQKPEEMIVKSLIVNKAQAYYRGVPMARGRQRIFRKFLSHVTLQLGYPEQEGEKPATKKRGQSASQNTKKTVQTEASTASKPKKLSGMKNTKTTTKTVPRASSAKGDSSSSSPALK